MDLYDFAKSPPAIIRAKRRALLNSPVFVLAVPRVVATAEGVRWDAQGEFTVETNGITEDEQIVTFLRYIADYIEASASGLPPLEEWRP